VTRLAWVVIAATLVACADISPYYCEADADCFAHGQTGKCIVAYSACAFPDQTCTVSKLRYDDSAGYLANVCVGDEAM
jgi:hypothetical protein